MIPGYRDSEADAESFGSTGTESNNALSNRLMHWMKPPRASVHEQRRFYQPELNRLRFYAFAGVFVCHTLPLGGLFYRRLHLPMPSLWGLLSGRVGK
jgi:hypothetical protein